ncbi:MAG: hypothetical protein AABY07_01130 [Nanoarchaeota archaeon]
MEIFIPNINEDISNFRKLGFFAFKKIYNHLVGNCGYGEVERWLYCNEDFCMKVLASFILKRIISSRKELTKEDWIEIIKFCKERIDES